MLVLVPSIFSALGIVGPSPSPPGHTVANATNRECQTARRVWHHHHSRRAVRPTSCQPSPCRWRRRRAQRLQRYRARASFREDRLDGFVFPCRRPSPCRNHHAISSISDALSCRVLALSPWCSPPTSGGNIDRSDQVIGSRLSVLPPYAMHAAGNNTRPAPRPAQSPGTRTNRG